MMDTPPQRIPDERVAGILARAAELDRDRRDSFTVEAVRAAAIDAGISLSAVDTALAEYAAQAVANGPAEEPAEDRKPRFARVRRFFRKAASALKTPAKLAGVFFLLGLAGAAGEGAVILGWAAWLLMAGRLIWQHRPARTAAPFVLALVLMTLALATGFAAAEVDEDPIAALFGVGAPLLALGSLFIKVRLPRRFRSTAGELQAPAS